jgi:fatty-acyl-CoA synthase
MTDSSEEHVNLSPIGTILRERARAVPDRVFLRGMGKTLTWREFDALVDRFACALLARGIQKEDHVAVWMTNSPYWAVAFLACLRIGAILVPLNTRYKTEEVRYILQQSDARVLFMMDSYFGIDYHRILLEMAPELQEQDGESVSIGGLPRLRTIVTWTERELPGALALDQFLADALHPDLARAERDVRVDDVAIIVYTSGTTGKPKGAMHSHEVLRRVLYCAERMHVDSDSIVLGHMPFYHVGGLFLQLVMSVAAAGGLVLMPKWEPARALDLIVEHRVTHIGGTPTHFYDLINARQSRDVDTSCLRAAFIGGAVDMRGVITRSLEVFPTLKILPAYGLTEGTVNATMNHWDDPIDVLAANMSPPLGDTRIRIVDIDTGAQLPPGERGEILIAGSLLMKGYYKDPVATRNTITADGWLRTGDIGLLSPEGYLRITDRLKEMFKTGGTNAYPAEIEAHLNTMPQVAESVVVGVPDVRLSEVGFAFVRLKAGQHATPAQIIAHCRGKIADYKVPRHMRIVASFPMTETGKIRKAALRQIARDEVQAALRACS